MDTLPLALEQVATLPMLAARVAGSFLGIVIGAIPGLGPGVAIAILLPFTLGLEPLIGITLLMGIYAGA